MNDITDHLKHHFKKASPVLFTGAGFSCDAVNIAGANLPSASQLKEMLWKICFPSKPLDPSNTLQDLFSMAKKRHEGDLKRLLSQSFTVDAAKLPEWYGTVFSLPWYRVYTLNIDDLALAVQRRFSLPRVLNSVSATTGKLRA
ncbi:MAG TPA: hypothetical protein VHO24_05230, partial [Opitutaceae bacterium]|nr:hypothetical protein [Opitutaceae bacterium]